MTLAKCPPGVSVVITAHNERKGICGCLESLASQAAVARGEAEIILVDDRSTDGTGAAAAALRIPALTILSAEEGSGGSLTTRQRALDLGFRAAKGEIILVTDADAIAPPNWIDRMSAPIHAGQSDAVAGAISFRDGQTLVRYWQNADVAYYLVFCRAMVGLNFSTGVFFGNFAFRRADYLAFGFGKIGPALTEDLSFAKALHANGKAITFDPSSLIDVEACGNLRTLLERTLRISAGSVSILSVFLAGWLLLFVILAIAAALLGGVWTMLFVIRYCVGVAVVVLGLSGTRQYSLFPFALFQETLSIFLAMAAGVLILRGSKVVWGGNAYDR